VQSDPDEVNAMSETCDSKPTQLPGAVDTLRAALNAEIPTFLLIDALVGEPLFIGEAEPGEDPQRLRETAWQRPVQRIALHGSCKLPVHQHPYLVMLEGVNDPLLEQTMEMAERERHDALADGLDGNGMAVHRIGGWLQSTMAPSELSAHIASLLRLRTDAPTVCRYLRLVDRRTLALLCHVAGVARVVAQMGGLQTWCYLDVQGELAVLQSSGAPSRPVCLNTAEWQTMANGMGFNRALAQWLGEAERTGNRETLLRPASQLYSPLAAALESAKKLASEHRHCFPTLGDQTVWAALSMLQPFLSRSPAVSNMLGNAEEPFRYAYRHAEAVLRAERLGKSAPALY
jgi:hypothetical protein